MSVAHEVKCDVCGKGEAIPPAQTENFRPAGWSSIELFEFPHRRGDGSIDIRGDELDLCKECGLRVSSILFPSPHTKNNVVYR